MLTKSLATRLQKRVLRANDSAHGFHQGCLLALGESKAYLGFLALHNLENSVNCILDVQPLYDRTGLTGLQSAVASAFRFLLEVPLIFSCELSLTLRQPIMIVKTTKEYL